MPSVSISKKNYDAAVIRVGSDKVNDFVNAAVEEKLKVVKP